MNTISRTRFLAFAMGFAALALHGAQTPSTADVVDPVTSPLWSDIKNDTYDQRAHFAAGVNRLSAKLDDEIRQLKAKRDTMKVDIKDWDFAMKEVDESRSLLTSRMSDLAQATTPEAWVDDKEKVGEAWKRSQLAIDKMNTTVTS